MPYAPPDVSLSVEPEVVEEARMYALRCMVFLGSLAIAYAPAHGEPPQAFDGELTPDSSYTLVAPYRATVASLMRVGQIAKPEPASWPSGILGVSTYRYFDELKPFIDTAQAVALARLERIQPDEERRAVSTRLQAASEELAAYGFRTWEANRPPWELDYFHPVERWMMQEFRDAHEIDATSGFLEDKPVAEHLKAFRADGKIPDVLLRVLARVTATRPVAFTQEQRSNAVEAFLVWAVRRNLVYFYPVQTDPFSAAMFEPNHPGLIDEDGNIQLVLPRAGGQRSGLVNYDYVPFTSLINYWKSVTDDELWDANDRGFLDAILFGKKKTGYGEAERRAVVAQMLEELDLARKEVYKGAVLGNAVAFATTYEPPSADWKKNQEALLREYKLHNWTAPADDIIQRTSRAMTVPAPLPRDPGSPSWNAPPAPSVYSTARVLNELRPSMAYSGLIIRARERDGLLTLRGTDEQGYWFDYNLRLWTVTLPLGGDGDSGSFTARLNRDGYAKFRPQFADVQQLFQIEVRTGLALSPLFVEVTRAFSFDSIAAGLREFEYQKIEMGRTLRPVAERILDTNRRIVALDDFQRRADSRGFFFVPEAAQVIETFVAPGAVVQAGDELMVVRPIYKHRFSYRVSSAQLGNFLIGSKHEAVLDCDAGTAMQVAQTPNPLYKTAGPRSVAARIASVAPNEDGTDVYRVVALVDSAEPPPSTGGAPEDSPPAIFPAAARCRMVFSDLK